MLDTWDSSGTGKNIIKKLRVAEKHIWNAALPYQDARQDTSHAEHVTYFALYLLTKLKAQREVVIPAAILHDIGWSQLTKRELSSFYKPHSKKHERYLRIKHQQEGVKLARKILQQTNYPKKYVDHILEIISQHDTRRGFYSKEDKVVRDADRLWRFTLACAKIQLNNRTWTVLEFADMMNKQMQGFATQTAKKLAIEEMNETLNVLAEPL